MKKVMMLIVVINCLCLQAQSGKDNMEKPLSAAVVQQGQGHKVRSLEERMLVLNKGVALHVDTMVCEYVHVSNPCVETEAPRRQSTVAGVLTKMVKVSQRVFRRP